MSTVAETALALLAAALLAAPAAAAGPPKTHLHAVGSCRVTGAAELCVRARGTQIARALRR